MPPNILWIVFDTARADAFEPYGAPVGSSPALADLARRGEASKDVRSTACWTVPAHLSMFAGGLPRQLGLANQAGLKAHNLQPILESQRERLISEVLTRSGYRTAGVSANAWVSHHSGFGTGFEQFVDSLDTRHAKMAASSRRARARWLMDAAHAREDDGARAAERQLETWIAEGPGRPFFWFVNLVECHSPYLPPKPFAELGPLERVKAADEASRYLTQGGFWRACVTGDVPPEPALERMRAGYRGAIRYMDEWLGRLLERLDTAGLLDETLVIVSSDHGENFGEGDLIGHAFSLDDRLTNVPFVAAGPGADRLSGVRSFVELPGRLVEVAEVTDHPYDPGRLPPLPVAQFDSPAPPPTDPRTVYAVDLWNLDEAAAHRLTMPLLSVVDDRVKMVVRGSTETFHDLDADPLELVALRADEVDTDSVRRLRAAAAHPTVVASEARLDTRAGPPPSTDVDVADLEDRMRLLGYL